MADSAFEPPRGDNNDNNDEDAPEVIRDLDKMIESMELISVQLTWMAYDMVVLRTNPELELSMRSLHEAHERCRAVVFLGGQEPETESDL